MDEVELNDWKAAGLRLPSFARIAKLATVAKTTVIPRLGRLSARATEETRDALHLFFRGIAARAD